MAVIPGNTDFQAPKTYSTIMPQISRQFVNPRTGEVQDKSEVWVHLFVRVGDRDIALPKGLAIDTMRPTELRGSQEFIDARSEENALLASLQQYLATLKPGEERELNLVVKARRVNERLAPSTNGNVDFTQLFAMPVAMPVAAE